MNEKLMNKWKEIKEKAADKPVKEKPIKEKPVKEKSVKEKPVKEKPIKEKKLKETAADGAALQNGGEKGSVKDVLKTVADKAKVLFEKVKELAGKLSKEPKEAKDKKPVGKLAVQIFSIRNKIFVCFLIPIIFMIVVGTVAYNKAAEGMQEKYQESTLQTINMVNEYIEMNYGFITAEAMKYAFDDGIHKYAFGMMTDLAEQKEVVSSTKKNLQSTQKTNELVSNFHIIPMTGANVITTKTAARIGEETDGFYNEYMENTIMEGKTPKRWIDTHPLLDEKLGVEESDYIMTYQLQSNKQSFILVVDIASEGIENLLKNMDLGEGSIIGFVTENGRELLLESVGEGKESVLTEGEKVFFGQEFYTPINEEDNMSGYQEVKFKGKNYLFLYTRSDSNHATICALVPMDVVTGQAESIKSITVKLVLLAIVIAAVIGIWIAAGITGNMKRISRRFGEVAKGDLTVKVTAKGKDEFNQLAASATDMIYNNKKLVSKVNRSTDDLAGSAQEVKDASFIISDYSEDITAAISGINEGMQKQSEYAQFCVEKTS
ncbi:MAG: HAMP domain-containing protein, partial [Firmicutes bacterium]|nr:HAMP domain-containing protein [Bacillota bacterium]